MIKTAVVYGDIQNPIQKKALLNLSEILLDYAGCHPACFGCEDTLPEEDYIVFYLGTKQNNRYIREKSTATLSHAEEYSIVVDQKEVIIEGHDDCGVLYGVSDFLNKYISGALYCDGGLTRSPLERNPIPKFSHSEYPKIKNRGLWTWGYTILNYRGYIDNMVKLKMNTVVIWNDFAPLNANELVEYAHSCGVRVIWGMPWLWGVDCSVFDLSDLDRFSEIIFKTYEEQYGNVKGDGVYFQTFTELDTEYIGKYLIAEASANFVNRTAALFFEKYPDMELQFGLHATSVKEKTNFIGTVDPRIRIVWENCGSFPYWHTAELINGYDETVAFTEKIATLRGRDDRFGFVGKSMVKLDWTCFEHLTGPHFIGVGSKIAKAKKLTEKKMVRKYEQSYWIKYADHARRAYRALQVAKDGDLYDLSLVEDSMFDEKPFLPVALFSEFIWNPECDTNDILAEVSLRDYVECE